MLLIAGFNVVKIISVCGSVLFINKNVCTFSLSMLTSQCVIHNFDQVFPLGTVCDVMRGKAFH